MRRNQERGAPDEDMPLDVPLDAPARDDLRYQQRPEGRALDGRRLGGRLDGFEGKIACAGAHWLNLLGGRRLDRDYLDIEEQGLARQWGVEVEQAGRGLDGRHGDGP